MEEQQHNVTVVGNYLLGGLIGKGTYGKVYKGLDSVTGKFAAIKILKKTNKIIEIKVRRFFFIQFYLIILIVELDRGRDLKKFDSPKHHNILGLRNLFKKIIVYSLRIRRKWFFKRCN